MESGATVSGANVPCPVDTSLSQEYSDNASDCVASETSIVVTYSCAICNRDIIERSDKAEGEAAIFCEGDHQQWLHASCAGLSKEECELLEQDNETFEVRKMQAR